MCVFQFSTPRRIDRDAPWFAQAIRVFWYGFFEILSVLSVRLFWRLCCLSVLLFNYSVGTADKLVCPMWDVKRKGQEVCGSLELLLSGQTSVAIIHSE